MKRQGASELEEKIHLAEQNLARCVSRLSEQAQAIGTYPVVDDKAFDKMLRLQCPIWPYC